MSALVLLLAAASGASGQQAVGTIVGQVVQGEARTPMLGAQVIVVGTQLGALTGAEGRFVIRNVPAGARMVRVQAMGFNSDDQPATVTAGGTVTVTFQLREQAVAISPVVVTALGITRNEKSLGYAVQSISSQTIERIPETTLIQALAGQSAGVSVISSSGRPGAGARITIRGETSFSGTGQPLFVIDGVPVATNTDGPSNPLGTGSAGSRGMDFDMENIDQVSVLRGAAATALYGSRAANGAIIIKTKQGKAGQPLRFTFNTEARFDRPVINGYVTDYAAGSRGYFCNGRLASQGGWCEPGYPGANSETQNNWGPHKDSIPQIVFDSIGDVRFRDAREDFYRTAPTVNSSLRGSGSMGERGTYTFGISYLDQQGINPIAELNRLNLNANMNIKLSEWLSSTTSVQRIRSDNPYGNDSYDGLTRTLINMPPSTDTRRAWNADGSPVMWGNNSPHFQWLAENEKNSELTNRWIASQQFEFTIAPGLRLMNNWGLDTYVSEFNRFVNERPWRTAQGQTSGSTRQRKNTRTTINDDITLSLDGRQIGETGITVSAMIGGNIYMQQNSQVTGEGDDIVIPDFFNISNFVDQDVDANLATERRLVGAYSQVTADYRDWAFLTLTGRNDWSSTLPTHANDYFYPSASLGIVFTDALNLRQPWLDYGKVRVSIAKVGNDAPPYALSTRYTTGVLGKGANNSIQQNGGPRLEFPFREINAYAQSNQLGNPDIKPEATVETEIGFELRMFDGRAYVDIAAYSKSSYDQIFSVPSSSVTGFSSITRNAGDLRNRGIEVSLRGRPIQLGDFSWDVGVNWARNRSQVLELAPGVTSISLAGYSWPQVRIMEGFPYGVLCGYGWKRNCSDFSPDDGIDPPCFSGAPTGALLIGDNGYPIRTDEQINLGTVMPNWIGSLTTDLRYKGLGLSALVDVKNGGQMINFETQYTVNNGRSRLTETRGTYVVHDGVNINTGQPNTIRLLRNQDYYPLVYGFDRHEAQLESAGFVKLREATLSYRVPRSLLGRLNLQDATVYLTGRNLKIWSDFSSGDPEGDIYGGTNAGGQYFRQFPEPQTRSWVIGMRSAF
ncbi:MAG: SusC/RagA family TonB-linked outer membrane protein [Pseudomonas sp.]